MCTPFLDSVSAVADALDAALVRRPTHQRGGEQREGDEEEFFEPQIPDADSSDSVPVALRGSSSSRDRDQASVPSPPGHDASTSTLLTTASAIMEDANKRRRSTRSSAAGLGSASDTPRNGRSLRSRPSLADADSGDLTVIPPTPPTPASRSQGKGKATAAAPFIAKAESSSPDLPSPETLWQTMTQKHQGKGPAQLQADRQPSSSLSAVGVESAEESDAEVARDLVGASAVASGSGSGKVGPIKITKRAPRSSAAASSTVPALKFAPPPAPRSPRKRKRKSDGGIRTQPAQKKKVRKSGVGKKESSADDAAFRSLVINIDSDTEEEDLDEGFENGDDGCYIVERILERRKVKKYGKEIWEFKVRWVRRALSLTSSDADAEVDDHLVSYRKITLRHGTPGSLSMRSKRPRPSSTLPPASSDPQIDRRPSNRC